MFVRYLVLVVLAAAACGMPHDPESTMEGIRERGVLRAGISESPPWIVRTSLAPDAEPSGVEADLIRSVARELEVDVQWHWGDLDQHLEAVEAFQLDIVGGGIPEKTPWKSRVALTVHHSESELRIGFPPGAEPLTDLDRARVAVPEGDAIAKLVEESGGEPVPSTNPFETGLPVAAPRTELEAHGYLTAGDPLEKVRHVLALPPGENRWLVTVDRHLVENRSRIESLRRSSTP